MRRHGIDFDTCADDGTGWTEKRDVLPDPVYGSKVVTKLINNLMIDGKKGKARRRQGACRAGRTENQAGAG